MSTRPAGARREGARALPFRFDLAARARVRLIETSSDYRPVLHIRRDCLDPSSEVACRDADSSDQVAVFTGVLDAGTYWVFADAESQESAGSFTLSPRPPPRTAVGTTARESRVTPAVMPSRSRALPENRG